MEYVLETHGLVKRYKNEFALLGLDMHVPKGAIYGFVGRNGAGKTTLIRIITGLHPASGGNFTLFDADSRSKDIHAARARTGAIVETPALYGSMSALDNLKTVAYMRGAAQNLSELLDFVGLSDVGKKKVKNFSLGMRQRLAIAMALVGNPDFLILDEPINGLDPNGIVDIRELILKLNRERGVTVLISSHILGELSRLATHYGFIERGSMVKEIDAKQLEAECRKKVVITLSDTAKLPLALEKLQIEYTILSEKEAEIYGEIPVGRLNDALKEQAIELLNYRETEEDLEAYFINLVGGAK